VGRPGGDGSDNKMGGIFLFLGDAVKKRTIVLSSALAAAAAGGFASRAQAQNINQYFLDSPIPFDVSRGNNVSVLERPRPDYEAAGIRTGSFLTYPQLKLGAGYSDNVYGQENNGVGDAFFAIDPKVTVASDWSRHSLTFDGGAKLRKFAKQTAKDEDGWFADGTGHVDIGDSSIETTGRIRRGYQSQNSGSFPVNSAQSIPFMQSSAEVRGTYQGARFRLVGFGDINRINFRNIRALDGTTLDQNFRDQRISRGSGRVEFAATPAAAAFVQTTYTHTTYDEKNALGGLGDRDSNEIAVIGGATFDLTSLVRGTIGAGYVSRKYQNPIYPDISGPTVDVRIDYFLSQLTTITLEGQRQIEDAITPGSGGFFVNSVRLRADHEARRNLIFNAYTGYERDQFKGISRRDTAWLVGGGADYFVNRRVGLSTTLDYVNRDSKGKPIGQIFNEFRATASILYQI
jgi:hypothetical protein